MYFQFRWDKSGFPFPGRALAQSHTFEITRSFHRKGTNCRSQIVGKIFMFPDVGSTAAGFLPLHQVDWKLIMESFEVLSQHEVGCCLQGPGRKKRGCCSGVKRRFWVASLWFGGFLLMLNSLKEWFFSFAGGAGFWYFWESLSQHERLRCHFFLLTQRTLSPRQKSPFQARQNGNSAKT